VPYKLQHQPQKNNYKNGDEAEQSLYPTYGRCKESVFKKPVLHINPAHYKNNKEQIRGNKRIKIYAIRTQAL
jgi:hypothetical protein